MSFYGEGNPFLQFDKILNKDPTEDGYNDNKDDGVLAGRFVLIQSNTNPLIDGNIYMKRYTTKDNTIVPSYTKIGNLYNKIFWEDYEVSSNAE